ncbi:hypothetical protein [uncultured Lamprocystis sp.]|uniref:hypothetical protein n=1 Tax=uncultured Lamprocystis sp. TaxID=543132 RepID=UPI0025D707BD|nr:hypothetical protein [uncultured Lamprocystis sp.]
MKFRKLSIENYKSFQFPTEILFPAGEDGRSIFPGITQFFFFDGEKIQEIAADDHSEVRLKTPLEAALGIQYINRLASDILYIKQDERKGYIEISDEDLDFKQSELKREKSKLARKHKERDDLKAELDGFKAQLDEAKKRFETRDVPAALQPQRVDHSTLAILAVSQGANCLKYYECEKLKGGQETRTPEFCPS